MLSLGLEIQFYRFFLLEFYLIRTEIWRKNAITVHFGVLFGAARRSGLMRRSIKFSVSQFTTIGQEPRAKSSQAEEMAARRR